MTYYLVRHEEYARSVLSFAKSIRFSCLLALCGACFCIKGVAQATLSIEPGLAIPNDDLPWAMERFQGADQIVPIHHSSTDINNHAGANFAGSLAGSFFYKPKTTTELPGVKARTTIHDSRAVFYLRYTPDPSDDGNPKANTTIVGWEILKAVVKKDKREFQAVRVNVLTNQGSHTDAAVDATAEELAKGWTKISPKEPMEPGEYAIVPIYKDAKYMATMLFDFSLDPASQNDKDAIPRSATP